MAQKIPSKIIMLHFTIPYRNKKEQHIYGQYPASEDRNIIFSYITDDFINRNSCVTQESHTVFLYEKQA